MEIKLPAAVFWDLDGTLINSEPYWAQSEAALLAQVGIEFDPSIAKHLQGTSLAFVAEYMREHGLHHMKSEEITKFMVDFVYKKEVDKLPWNPGVQDTLHLLHDAGIPQVLVTSSPRVMASNVVEQAGKDIFTGYLCNEDPVKHKPSSEPYLRAAEIAGVDITDALIFEDSRPGLTAAGNSGAHWVAVTGFSSVNAREEGLAHQFVQDFSGITLADIARFYAR
ncbi:HAD family hydrolase [Alloscardovia venturai]|uniref:HAD family hydrolase n=1 Tax=Alloscardovia venturai TaxID=1769421 RepID=A0ABW2Y2Z4_9BIFI